MADLSIAEYRSLLRVDFCSFVQRCFYELDPVAAFHMNWHLERGKARRNPPRRDSPPDRHGAAAASEIDLRFRGVSSSPRSSKIVNSERDAPTSPRSR
jgi:hypothetical protein